MNIYKRYRFPNELIQSVVFLYHRYALSLRDVQEMMMIRGIELSHETIRRWCLKFGPVYKKRLRFYQGPASDKWHLDEVHLKIKGKPYWLWRALDDKDQEIDILLQPRRNTKSAKRFFLKLLGKEGFIPRVMITDKLASYGAAKRLNCHKVLSLSLTIRNIFGRITHKLSAPLKRIYIQKSYNYLE